MFELKSIDPQAIPKALEKAERYRLLNQPEQAESICRDVLAVDADNQDALVMMLLALTDQFRGGPPDCFNQAQALVEKLSGDYEKHYYSGLIWERRGHAHAHHPTPGSHSTAYDWIHKAMEFYEHAERFRPPGNDDAILRWNNCVRLCERLGLRPEPEEVFQPVLGDD